MAQRVYKKTAQTRQAFIRAGRRLVEKNGYDNTSVRAICEEAGLSTGAFYHHFAGKDALLNSAFTLFDDTLTPKKLQGYEGMAPLEALAAVLVDQTAFSQAAGAHIMREYYRVLLQQAGSAAVQPRRTYIQTVHRCVQRAQRQGQLKGDVAADALTDFLVRCVRGTLVDWCLHGGAYNAAARVAEEIPHYLAAFVA